MEHWEAWKKFFEAASSVSGYAGIETDSDVREWADEAVARMARAELEAQERA